MVSTYTGIEDDGQTDSTVSITIKGQLGGECGPVQLDNGHNNYQLGQIDTFVFDCVYVGPIRSICIGMSW